jgi:glycosyltransferase involved in cell wall biosynthesis
MNRPIRVLELRSVRGTGGGPEKTIMLGAAGTDPTRFSVTVCYIRDRRDDVFTLDHRAKTLGIDYVEVLESHSFDRSIIEPLRQLLRSRQIDIVHSHDYKTNLLALLLARLEKIVPLSTAHGWTGNSGRERWLYYPADRRLLAWFPRVIAVSGDIRDALVRAGARADRVTVVLNGIDPERFKRNRDLESTARRRLEIEPSHTVIGAVGRLARQKRFDLLLDAVGPLLKRFPHLLVVIAGDGELKDTLAHHARTRGLASLCRFTGHVEDVISLHHAFDLFVQASDYEGTPNAVLEAMALETPVVATDAGGTAELVGHGVHGLITPRGNVRALTDALEACLQDPAAARARARAARARVENEISFEHRMRSVEAIYEALARGRARSSTDLRQPANRHVDA